MPIQARVLARSRAKCGKILTTWEAIYPRMIHDEILTHKMASRCSASSRAIPTATLIERVMTDPWIPEYIGKNQKGMQAGEQLTEVAREHAVAEWLSLRDMAVSHAQELVALNVHKQVVNRILQPWMWITVIISMTEDENFFGLRDHEMAEPHFHDLAHKMKVARDERVPDELATGDWHLPLFGLENGGQADDWMALTDHLRTPNPDVWDALSGPDQHQSLMTNAAKVSAGRCARVSYLTHDGRRNIADDLVLFERLANNRPMHASPLEHPAQALDWPEWFQRDHPDKVAMSPNELQTLLIEKRRFDGAAGPSQADADCWAALGYLRSGNFLGFRQLRKQFVDENIGGRVP